MPRKAGQVIKYFTLSDGSQHSVSAPTEREAYIKLAQRKQELEDKLHKYTSNCTLEEWGKTCIENKSCSEERKLNYLTLCKNHIFSEIGHIKLSAIRQIDCENCIKQMEGLSDYYIKTASYLLRYFFKKAMANHLMSENPARDMEHPRGSKTERRPLTEDERKAFLKVKDNPRFLPFEIMYYTGVRPSEVRNLKGEDILLINGVPTLYVKGTKTKNAIRKVPIPTHLYKKIKNTRKSDFICKSENDTKFGSKSFQRAFSSLKRAMNIELGCKVHRNALVPPFPIGDDFIPYCFRHDYTTRMCYANVNPIVLAKILGHRDTKLIAKIYSHINEELVLEDMVKKIESQ